MLLMVAFWPRRGHEDDEEEGMSKASSFEKSKISLHSNDNNSNNNSNHNIIVTIKKFKPNEVLMKYVTAMQLSTTSREEV